MRWSEPKIAHVGPVLICCAAILLTTLLLSMIDRFVPTEHLMLGYLLPTILAAIYFGSTLAPGFIRQRPRCRVFSVTAQVQLLHRKPGARSRIDLHHHVSRDCEQGRGGCGGR